MFRIAPAWVFLCSILQGPWAAEAELEAGKPFLETTPVNEHQFEMVPIPKGKIEIEDPENPGSKKTVEVGPFWISKTEVTWEMFDPFVDLEERAFMLDLPVDPDGITGPTPPYVPPDQGWGHEGYAALTMSHHSAAMYCRWLSKETGKKYRLPTEAEWEYVCRAGADTDCPHGNASIDIGEHAWYAADSENKTHPVATKKANPWGVHDMLGNAAEFVDGLDGTPVLKGGHFGLEPEDCPCLSEILQTKENLKEWLKEDPQIPQSIWWLAGPTYHGFRIVCEGKLTENR